MNCQSHWYFDQDPKRITRRWFFRDCAVGLGAIALGNLLRQNGYASDAALNPLVAPTPTAEPVQIVEVALLEWLIDMDEETRAGQVEFVVINEGAEAHGLVIESGGVVAAELPEPLAPGASSVLSVTLAPGEYVVYCPVGDGEHREEGMETTLSVVP